MFYKITRYYNRDSKDYIYWGSFDTKQEALNDADIGYDHSGNPVHPILLKVIEAPERPRDDVDGFFTNLFPETCHRNAGDITYL